MLRWLKDNDLEVFCRKFYANGFMGSHLLALTGSAFKVALKSSERREKENSEREREREERKNKERGERCGEQTLFSRLSFLKNDCNLRCCFIYIYIYILKTIIPAQETEKDTLLLRSQPQPSSCEC